jgi:hypothetical protein
MARKDLPSPNATNFLPRLREEMHVFMGKWGNHGDRALTVQDAIDAGVVAPSPGGGLVPGPGVGGGTGGGVVYVPDLTPPPQPGSLTATAAISHILIEVPPATYTQGHGHLRTRVYGATRVGAAPAPVFADAVEVGRFSGTVWAMPSNPATTWHLWARWESNDNVLSSTPAGGTNGVVAITGQNVSDLLAALAGQITSSQLASSLSTPIGQIPGIQQGVIDNAAAISAESSARATAISLEATNRTSAIAAASLSESDARTAAISAVDTAVRAAFASADQATISTLTSAFQAADLATLTSAQNFTYSRSTIDNAISASSTTLTSAFQAADAATLSSAQTFTYSRAAIDSADTATLNTARAEFASADSATLASAQNFTYSRATIDSAISTSTTTLRTQITGGYSGTDLNALTTGLLFQERNTRASQDAALSQQITLLSAGAGEQFDYSSIWYFDSSVESWTPNISTDTAMTAVNGWLRMAATSGTQTGRMFQSPAALDLNGAVYPQVRLRVRRVGTPTWVGRLYFTTSADSVWDTTKSLVVSEPTYAADIGLVTLNMPAGWTSATITQIRFEASTNVTTSVYFELDWVAIGRPSPGASSAQLAAEEVARAAGDAAEAAARLTLASEVATKASASAVDSLTTRVTAAEGVNTSQGSAITTLQNSVTTINGTLTNKADASALTALTTRVTAAEGVNTSQGTSITTLDNSLTALTTTVNTKADASALTDLTTRVTAAEGVNTSQGTSITTLNNNVSTLTTTVNTKADASALTALTTRVTAAEGVNTSQGSSITTLNNSLSITNTNVTAAQTAADNAATLAGSKGKVLVQSTTPVAGDQLAQNLWIDTTGGANTPKRWNGSSWVAVTDKVATDAAAAAAAAQTTANTKADASAVTALTTRVTNAEGTLTAQAGQITTLTTTVGNNTAAINTEASTRATQTGELYAQYTVKVDVGGLISGYGLASTANNAAPTSAFGVQAGQFFVAPPTINQATAPTSPYRGMVWRNSGTGLVQYWTGTAWSTTPQTLPFVVQTAPQVINGFTVDPGVYMEAAYMARLVATRGQIGLLSVDDARIASMSVDKLVAGSIAVGQHIQSTGYVPGSTGWRINGDGTAEFSQVTVRGTIFASLGAIGGWTIAANYLQSTTYGLGTSGTRLNSDGTGQIGGVRITGNTLESHTFDTPGEPSGFRLRHTGASEFKGVVIRSGTGRVLLTAVGDAVPPWVTTLQQANDIGISLVSEPDPATNTAKIKSLSAGYLTDIDTTDDMVTISSVPPTIATRIDQTQNSTTWADVQGVSWPVEADTYYEFDAFAFGNPSTNSARTWEIGFVFPTGTVASAATVKNTVISGDTPTPVLQENNTLDGSNRLVLSAGQGFTTVPASYGHTQTIKGLFYTSSTAGVVRVQFRRASGSGSNVLRRGSVFKVRKTNIAPELGTLAGVQTIPATAASTRSGTYFSTPGVKLEVRTDGTWSLTRNGDTTLTGSWMQGTPVPSGQAQNFDVIFEVTPRVVGGSGPSATVKTSFTAGTWTQITSNRKADVWMDVSSYGLPAGTRTCTFTITTKVRNRSSQVVTTIGTTACTLTGTTTESYIYEGGGGG